MRSISVVGPVVNSLGTSPQGTTDYGRKMCAPIASLMRATETATFRTRLSRGQVERGTYNLPDRQIQDPRGLVTSAIQDSI